MSNTITSIEYQTEISEIAESVVTESEGDQDLAMDLIHERLDGHSWIIYTYRNAQVLQHSSNDSAYFDIYGPLEATSYADFAAMHADVLAELGTAIDAYNEKQKDSETEEV